MNFLESDEFFAMIIPIIVFWIYSGLYEISGNLDKYRLHSRRDEDIKNLVSKPVVIRGVLLLQAIQASIAFIIFKVTKDENAATQNHSFTTIAVQFFIAMLVFDTWQYFVHRFMHMNKFLYRNFHSWHHSLVVPYGYGAQYNHPVDAILTETMAGALAFYISGMSPRTSIYFFSFATIKGIDDHCGMMLPWNPFHLLFGNNTAYHDIHHQFAGSKYNFSQAFFVTWDKIFDTYVQYKIEKRVGGGYEAKIVKA